MIILVSAALISGGGGTRDHHDVHICLGQPQTFLCEVPKQGSLTRLQWTIEFEDPQSVPSVTHHYTSVDTEGDIFGDDRLGIRLEFNLTSKLNKPCVSHDCNHG